MGELVWQMDTMSQRVMGQIVYTSSDDTKESSIRVRLKSDGMEYDYQHADVKTETGLCGLYVFFFLSKLCDFSFRYLLLLLLLRRGLAGTTWQQNILSVKSVRLCMTHSLHSRQTTHTTTLNHRYRDGNHIRVQQDVTSNRTRGVGRHEEKATRGQDFFNKGVSHKTRRLCGDEQVEV